MSVYLTVDTILDILFFQKKGRFVAIIIILLISFAIVYFATWSVDKREVFVENQSISLYRQNDGVWYGSDGIYFYALAPDIYFQAPLENECETFNDEDFITWCGSYSFPKEY